MTKILFFSFFFLFNYKKQTSEMAGQTPLSFQQHLKWYKLCAYCQQRTVEIYCDSCCVGFCDVEAQPFLHPSTRCFFQHASHCTKNEIDYNAMKEEALSTWKEKQMKKGNVFDPLEEEKKQKEKNFVDMIGAIDHVEMELKTMQYHINTLKQWKEVLVEKQKKMEEEG